MLYLGNGALGDIKQLSPTEVTPQAFQKSTMVVGSESKLYCFIVIFLMKVGRVVAIKGINE